MLPKLAFLCTSTEEPRLVQFVTAPSIIQGVGEERLTGEDWGHPKSCRNNDRIIGEFRSPISKTEVLRELKWRTGCSPVHEPPTVSEARPSLQQIRLFKADLRSPWGSRFSSRWHDQSDDFYGLQSIYRMLSTSSARPVAEARKIYSEPHFNS